MKSKSPKLISAILLVTLLASCNTGNKVASSFGKRKYTKGYFFNSSGHGKTELPVIAVKKAPETNNRARYTTVNTKAISPVSTGSTISPAKQKKVNPLNISKTIIGKIQHTLVKDNTQNISLSSQSSNSYGVPGHGEATDVSGSEYDIIATVSLICALLAVGCLLLLSVAGASAGFLFGLSLLSIVTGFICGIIGIKSKKNFGQALAGLIICGVAVLIGLFYLILFVAIFAAI